MSNEQRPPDEPTHPALAWKNDSGAFYAPLPGQRPQRPGEAVSRNSDQRTPPPASNLEPDRNPIEREPQECRICGLEILTVDGYGKPCLCMVNHSIPRGLRHARIWDFKHTENPTATQAYNKAVEFMESRSSHNGLYIWGPPGAGKSHLAAAIANAMLTVRCTLPRPGVTFWPIADTLADLRAGMTNGLADEIMADLDDSATRDLLMILDDLGAERLTDFAADTVSTIIRKRTNARQPMIVTANVPITRPQGYNGQILADILDGAITSRLQALHQIALFGRDLRQKGHQ